MNKIELLELISENAANLIIELQSGTLVNTDEKALLNELYAAVEKLKSM